MRPGAFAVFVAVLVLLHALLRVGLGLGASSPDLLTVAVLLAARRTSAGAAALLGVGLGLLDDATGIGRLGSRGLALGLAGVLGNASTRWIEGRGLPFAVIYLFLGKGFSDLALRFIGQGGSLTSTTDFATRLALAAAYAAVAGAVALGIFRNVAGRDA